MALRRPTACPAVKEMAARQKKTVCKMCILQSVCSKQTLTHQYLFVDPFSSAQWCISQHCVYGCLQAFSLQHTCRSFFGSSSSIPPKSYSSLNGIRVLSLLWIICGHSTQFLVINNLGMKGRWQS